MHGGSQIVGALVDVSFDVEDADLVAKAVALDEDQCCDQDGSD